MKSIFLQRHGAADSRGNPRGDRRLTADGSAALVAAARALAASGLRVDVICHSPLTRTRQTAELMRPVLAPGGKMLACPPLAPGVDLEALVAWLGDHLGVAQAILLIGHMPDVALIASLWATGAASSRLIFDPGALARIDFPGGRAQTAAAQLRWLVPVPMLAHPAASLLD